MYLWNKRSLVKVKERGFLHNVFRYRSRSHTVFFAMILTMMLLILYHIAASDSESPKVIRDSIKMIALEKMKKRTMVNINEVMVLTQPPDHLAWQKEYEGKIMAAAKKNEPHKISSFDSMKGCHNELPLYQELMLDDANEVIVRREST